MAIYFYMVRTFHMKHAKNRGLYIILKYLDLPTTFFLNKTSAENEVQGVLALREFCVLGSLHKVNIV